MRRVNVLVIGAMLALVSLVTVDATDAGGVTVTPARPETVIKHVDAVWPCAYFKPHTGDASPWLHAWNNESNPYIDTADCAATHTAANPEYDHLYCVTEWHHNGNGDPISPPVYTWQGGWC